MEEEVEGGCDIKSLTGPTVLHGHRVGDESSVEVTKFWNST